MRRVVASVVASAILSAGLASAVMAASGATTRVSVASDGAQGNALSRNADVSGDGRFVAFDSAASTLVPDDTNGLSDVFVRDRLSGTTARVSVATGGAQGNGASLGASISRDGRWVTFVSTASTLVPDDTNGVRDVFVHDRLTATTSRVSLTASGAQAAGTSFAAQISGDGRYVALYTFSDLAGSGAATGFVNAYRVDRTTGQVDDVCIRWDGLAIRLCVSPAISEDGRYVAFEAQGQLAADDTNGVTDIYVRDMTSATTTRVSVSSGGAQANAGSVGPSISADGRVVAFTSSASNLVPGDVNAANDVFVRDLATGTTESVSVGVAGSQANGASWTRQPSGASHSVSADGRYVVFHSFASNLVETDANGAADVFVRDRAAARTAIASLTWEDLQNGFASNGSISADGRYVTFESASSNFVVGDTNGVVDVFIRDLRPSAPPVTYTDRRTGASMAIQLDPGASDLGSVTFTIPGTATYTFDAAAGMRSTPGTSVLIDHSGPAVRISTAARVAVSVELRARLDPERHIAEATLTDSEGRRYHLVARP